MGDWTLNEIGHTVYRTGIQVRQKEKYQMRGTGTFNGAGVIIYLHCCYSLVSFRANFAELMLYHSEVCTNGYPCSGMVAQMSLINNDQDIHPYPLQRKTLNKSMP